MSILLFFIICFLLRIKQTPGSPEWFMAASHSSTEEHRNLTHAALLAEEATKYMSHALGLSPDQISYGLPEMDVSSTSLTEVCPVTMEFPCEAHKYRSMTGHCNNVQNPHWGNAGTRYVRYLPPDYADGISLPRGTAQYGAGIPSGREVSIIVHGQADIPHSHLVSIAAVWAQFVTHDISHTPQMSVSITSLSILVAALLLVSFWTRTTIFKFLSYCWINDDEENYGGT